MEVAVRRPQRWDAPLSDAMREVDVDRLLELPPFRDVDPAVFPSTLALRDILRNDCRILRCQPGDIVVREGDYGSSAFFILSGSVRVVLSGLSASTIGRPEPEKLSWLGTLAKVLSRPRLAEVRSPESLAPKDHSTAASGDPERPRIFLQDVPRVLEETDTVSLGAGELFGELAALTRSPRSATVFAETPSVLLEIRWQGLRDLMRRTDAMRRHIERLYRENSLRVHLRETPLLADLPPERLDALADATLFETHGEFDWHAAYESAVRRRPEDALLDEPLIAEEGTPSDGLILVRTGFVRLSRRYGASHRTLGYLGRGQAFGLIETIESSATGERTPWRHSLRALGYVDVLRIPQHAFVELVLPYVPQTTLDTVLGEQRKQLGFSTPERAAPKVAPSNSPISQQLLESIVDRRLMNGREAMAIDLDRCTRCDDCVRACAATHDNNPRFTRQGFREGGLMIAQACMHCVDPVCMIGCPTGAIARDATSGVVRINDRTCIGCSTCANSCPYDAIRMVEIRDQRGAVLADESSGQPILKATKCDLCADLSGGPACQRACPHDALLRVELGNLGELSEWLGRRA